MVMMNRKNGKLTTQFGLKIKMERQKRNLSQEKLAELANLSKNSIGAIERGESSPTLETIGMLANAFKMDIKQLIDTSKVDL